MSRMFALAVEAGTEIQTERILVFRLQKVSGEEPREVQVVSKGKHI